MKRCPECRRDYYDDSLLYCLDDGTALLEGPASDDGSATAIFTDEQREAPATQRFDREGSVDRSWADTQATRPSSKRNHIIITGALGLIALAAVAFLAYRQFRSTPSGNGPRRNDAVQILRLTGDGRSRGAQISPDGKFLAYLRVEGEDSTGWLKQIQTNTDIPILKPGDLFAFDSSTFTPDGNFLYFSAQSKSGDPIAIYRMATLGGAPAKVVSNGFYPGISPDGRLLVFLRFDLSTSQTQLIVSDADGRNERIIATRDGSEFFSRSPVFSPDGQSIAVVEGKDDLLPEAPLWFSVVSLADGTTKPIGEKHFFDVDDIAWHPSGDSLIAVGIYGEAQQSQLYEISYPTGELRRLTNDLNDYISASITADGSSIVTNERYSRSAIWVSPDLKPENAKQVMPDGADTWGFGWTADGRIVYASDQTGAVEIWMMDADGANARPLTSDRSFKSVPVASMDGKYIVYYTPSGGGRIVRINIDGSSPVVLSNLPGSDNPDISPDSRWVVFNAWIKGESQLLRVPIEGGEPQVLIGSGAMEPRYSRDGTRIACFIPNEKGPIWNRLAIFPAEGGEPLRIFDPILNVNVGRGPVWTPDDTGIAVILSQGEYMDVWIQPVGGGQLKRLTNFQTPGAARREYSRDGKRIAFVRAQGFGNVVMMKGYR